MFFGYFVIIYLDYGLYGACIASGVSYFLNMTLITIKCYLNKDLKESFFMPSRECLDGLKDYLKMGVPMAMQITLDYMVVELQVILASFLSISSSAAMVVLVNAQVIFFMFSYCIMISAIIFVGKSMGSGNS